MNAHDVPQKMEQYPILHHGNLTYHYLIPHMGHFCELQQGYLRHSIAAPAPRMLASRCQPKHPTTSLASIQETFRHMFMGSLWGRLPKGTGSGFRVGSLDRHTHGYTNRSRAYHSIHTLACKEAGQPACLREGDGEGPQPTGRACRRGHRSTKPKEDGMPNRASEQMKGESRKNQTHPGRKTWNCVHALYA